MSTAPTRTLLGLVGVTLLVGTGGPATAALPAQASCSRPLVIGLAGSGEHDLAGGYGETVARAVKQFRRTYGKPTEAVALAATSAYPAADPIPLGAFVRSLEQGTRALTKRLRSEHDRCRGRPIVLIGYSQGAAVINRTMIALDDRDVDVLEQIVAIELLADPQRLGNAEYTRGTANLEWDGLTIALGLYPDDDLPASIADRVDSFCTDGDTVCATKPRIVHRLTQPASALAELVSGYFAARLHQRYYLSSGTADRAGKSAAGRLEIALRRQHARDEPSSDRGDEEPRSSPDGGDDERIRAQAPPSLSASFGGKGGPAGYGIEGTTISYIDLEWDDVYPDESGFVARMTNRDRCPTCSSEPIFIDADATSTTVEIGVPYHGDAGDELCFSLRAQFSSGSISETPPAQTCLTLPG